ncbi:MAG: tripartite tricarboxylate transporter substrate binding protein [Betaproteobacteria bacterium]|nr:tripartite tricarboxylate transporter substrate binding protein [Betaproteobacteria bacterium]
MKHFVLRSIAVLLMGSVSQFALAQAPAYPVKPIRMIVGFSAGGGTDLLSRILGAKMSEMLGQPVVVDNRPGAGGTIAADMVARAAPDGYTLNAPTISYAVSASFYKLPYDPVKDITPITVIGTSGYLMVVNPKVPAVSMKEFLALAKARPGELNYGSSGHGGISHLAIELFKLMAGVQLTHVPYKGTAPVLTDLLSGQIQFTAGAIPPTMPHVKNGRLRAIGISTAQRSKLAPDVPTVTEAGVPGYDVASWYAISGPPGMPRQLVAQLNGVLKRILAMPDVSGRFEQEGVQAAHSSPEELARIIRTDIANVGESRQSHQGSKMSTPNLFAILGTVLSAGLIYAASSGAQAQPPGGAAAGGYPEKPLRLLVGNAPGGGSDITARNVAERLSESLGRSIVVDNRPGAGGVIAMNLAAQAAPNGYTLLVVAGSDLASAWVRKRLSFDPRRGYAPTSQLTSQYYLLLVTPSLPIRSVRELIDYAKARPGALSFGSAGVGSAAHAGLESFKSVAEVDIVHVPYKGIGPALIDMVGGQLHLAFASTISGTPHVKSGRLRALAVTRSARARAFPDLQSVSEAGVPGFELTNWYGLYAPAATPAAIVSTLHCETVRALKGGPLQAQITKGGAEPAPSASPAEFSRLLAGEVARWEAIMKLPGFADSLR